MIPLHPSLARVLPLLPLLALAAAPSAQEPIRWRSGPPTTVESDPRAIQRILASAVRRGRARHVVVQFDRGLASAQRGRLEAAGLTLSSYLGGHAWFAALSAVRLDAPAILAEPTLLGIEEVQTRWKLHPLLADGETAEWSIVDASDPTDPRVAAYVLFHPDVPLDARTTNLVTSLGARVVDVLETVNGLVIELARSNVVALAQADEVQWIEPPLPRMDDVSLPATAAALPLNDSNRSRTQADQVQAGPYNLDGSGVTVLVYDGGTARSSHNDFGGRLSVHDASGMANHATHVSGTIGGNGSASGGTFRGMAPAVTLRSYGFQFDGTGTFLYTNPGDLETDYDEAINTFGADISNDSIGTNTEPNGFLCNIQGDYGVTASVIDSIVAGSLGSPFRIVWSNGNERQGDRCDVEGFGDYYSTAPPATAKNHIAVGALNSNDDSMTSFSSWGPTDDGRIKPDISAPGCQSSGDFAVTSASSSSDTAYTQMCGTSMSGPTTAGCCALILEDYRIQFGGADPRNSTLKALLAQTAVDLGNTGPDYQVGYGSIRVKDCIDFMRLGQFREDSLALQGDSFVYTVAVGAGASELELTLAWDDVPGTPNVFGALVNDLDLRVFDPLGGRHFPWTLDPTNPGLPAVRTLADHLNNVEQVTVDSPMAGTWRIEVHGFDLPSGPQVLSLASSHPLTAGPFVQIGFPGGVPEAMSPGVATAVTARIVGIGEALVGGSPTLHYRFGGGAFLQVPMGSLGGDLYEASLPAASCADAPEFYVSALGALSGLATNPLDAPSTTFLADVEDVTVVFADDFELDQGWTVVDVSLTDGPWQRGIPVGGGDRGDPAMDFDGSGRCFLTDNVDGNSDVDGGPTRLISPTIDLSGGEDYYVRFAWWFANNNFDADSLQAQISNDGGSSWITMKTVGNTGGWVVENLRVADFVAPTANVVVRFNATDNPNDSVSEAAVDAFAVRAVSCTDVIPVADFIGTPTSGDAPLDVSFTDISVGNVTSWAWDFGDGGVDSVQNPSHTYARPGTYTVSLAVSGPMGGDGETKVDYVAAAKPPQVGVSYGSGSPGSLGVPTMNGHSSLQIGDPLFLIGGNMPPATAAFLAISASPWIPPADLSNGLILNLGLPILALVPLAADAGGEVLVSISLTVGLSGLSIFSQAVTFDGVGLDVFASSPGLRVDIP